MKVLVLEGTGTAGSQVVRELLARGVRNSPPRRQESGWRSPEGMQSSEEALLLFCTPDESMAVTNGRGSVAARGGGKESSGDSCCKSAPQRLIVGERASY
jgi:hypothetical protein